MQKEILSPNQATQGIQQYLHYQQEFLQHYLENGKSANSLKCYRLDFQCFNEFLLSSPGYFAIQSFNNEAVESFRHFLESRYQNINSVRRKLQTLRLFFDFLVLKRVYPENPIKKIASAPKALLPPHPLVFEQTMLLFHKLEEQVAAAEQSDLSLLCAQRNLILFHLVYHGCLNVSQISALQLDDILLSQQQAPRVLIAPKKRDPYSVMLPLAFQSLYQNYSQGLRRYQEKNNLKFTQLLFNANAHKILRGGLSARGIEEIFRRWSEAFHLSVTPKALRQSGILNWINQKIPTGQISERLGVAPSYNFANYLKYYQDNAHCQQYQDLI